MVASKLLDHLNAIHLSINQSGNLFIHPYDLPNHSSINSTVNWLRSGFWKHSTSNLVMARAVDKEHVSLIGVGLVGVSSPPSQVKVILINPAKSHANTMPHVAWAWSCNAAHSYMSNQHLQRGLPSVQVSPTEHDLRCGLQSEVKIDNH